MGSIDHIHRPATLGNLSVLLRYRFERLKDPGDLEKGILMAVEAVAVTPLQHPIGASCLRQLGNILEIRDREYQAPTLASFRRIGPSGYYRGRNR